MLLPKVEVVSHIILIINYIICKSFLIGFWRCGWRRVPVTVRSAPFHTKIDHSILHTLFTRTKRSYKLHNCFAAFAPQKHQRPRRSTTREINSILHIATGYAPAKCHRVKCRGKKLFSLLIIITKSSSRPTRKWCVSARALTRCDDVAWPNKNKSNLSN